MSVRANCWVGVVLALLATTAFSQTGSTRLVGNAASVLMYPASFVDEYRHSDKCLNTGEKLQQSAAKSGLASAVPGMVVGGLVGGLIPGPGRAARIVGGAAVGGSVTGLAGAAMANRRIATAMEDSRELDRQRDIELCHLVGTSQELIRPVWENFVASQPSCFLNPDSSAVNDADLQACVGSSVTAAAELQNVVRTRYTINVATCQSGLGVWLKYDRLIRANLRPGQSHLFPNLPICDGGDLHNQYRWLFP